MDTISLVLLSAGNSTRFGLNTKKQWLRFGHIPMWKEVANNFSKIYTFDKIVIVGSASEIPYMKNFSSKFEFVAGGDSRQESLNNALQIIQSTYVLVHDIARVCVPQDIVLSMIQMKNKADVVVPYIAATDTVVYEDMTINRDNVKLIQTPQLSLTASLKSALDGGMEYTDDRGAILAYGGSVEYVEGSTSSHKLTHIYDIDKLECLRSPSLDIFVGHGYDVHPFILDKQMVLCGVEIESDFGFKAHSDGDVALHALIDALLGATGAGDIGELFPDTDDSYEGIDSKKLLEKVVTFIRNVGYEIINVDITILAETPKLQKYKVQMRSTVARILKVEPIFINIKATTTERLGFVGKKEGVAVHASVNLKYFDYRTIRKINERTN